MSRNIIVSGIDKRVNMIKLVERLINGIIIGFTTAKITEQITEKRFSFNKQNVLGILIFSIILNINYQIINNFLKVIIIFLTYILLNKIIYKENLEKTIIVSFVEYINALISECIVGVILSLIMSLLPIPIGSSMDSLKNTLLLNIVIMATNYLLAKKLKNIYKKVVEQTKDNSALILTILAIIILICIGSLFYKIEIKDWNFNSDFLLNAIVIIVMGIVGILIILQRLSYEKVNQQYKDLAKYSEINASLLEDYSVLNHEHKNQLIVIKGMLESKSEELEEYVDSLLENKDKIKYTWIRDLNNITFQGLKSFINYKILEMKSRKLKVYVTISKECKKYKIERLTTHEKDQIYSIIGVYLDNAMEAAEESKKKEINITGYIQNKEMYIEIANTYAGEINLDKINNYGYTSKGTGHGTGLYMIEKIVRNSNHFNTKTEIRNGFFIQTLIINFPEK